ncbi:hypothetical protein Tco_0604497 [Tanacetum coccineum]
MSLVRSGRGKGYTRSGDQEENVPSSFKKNVVPRKTRSLTVADNIMEEPTAVKLANLSVLKNNNINNLKIQLFSHFKEILAIDSDATRDSSCSNIDEVKDDETDDSNDSDMDLSKDEPKGDDNAARFGVFMYNKSTKPLKSTYLNPTITCSSLEYIQSLLNEPPANELTDFMSNPDYIDAYTT